MYIHQHTCISAQDTFGDINIQLLHLPVEGKLKAREPKYDGIPSGILRRMGKAVRMGIGAAIPIVKSQPNVEGIILGTANGGMEDCIKFLNQIIDYEEGLLTPGNFVQSTPNAIAAQLGLMTANKGYNITHVHRGLSFENALLDTILMLQTHSAASYIVGAVDEISDYNYNIDYLAGWYKKSFYSADNLYDTNSSGSIAGEGAAMFLMNNEAQGAVAELKAVQTLHTQDEQEVKTFLDSLIKNHLKSATDIDVLITGENGDNRTLKFYQAAESLFENTTDVVRYKHFTGEFPTSSALALWLTCAMHEKDFSQLIKKGTIKPNAQTFLIYNNYKINQHSCMLVQKLR
ncbi:MAG: beta-ketoacyl synthase chain length factor [Bacteroidetes bacterium]|nr:beta-ketoacyl synthase chain length factor [Bacteroidota bacterium]